MVPGLATRKRYEREADRADLLLGLMYVTRDEAKVILDKSGHQHKGVYQDRTNLESRFQFEDPRDALFMHGWVEADEYHTDDKRTSKPNAMQKELGVTLRATVRGTYVDAPTRTLRLCSLASRDH